MKVLLLFCGIWSITGVRANPESRWARSTGVGLGARRPRLFWSGDPVTWAVSPPPRESSVGGRRRWPRVSRASALHVWKANWQVLVSGWLWSFFIYIKMRNPRGCRAWPSFPHLHHISFNVNVFLWTLLRGRMGFIFLSLNAFGNFSSNYLPLWSNCKRSREDLPPALSGQIFDVLQWQMVPKIRFRRESVSVFEKMGRRNHDWLFFWDFNCTTWSLESAHSGEPWIFWEGRG